MLRVTRRNNLSGDADGAADQGSFDQPLSGLIEGPLTLPGLATATTLFAGPPGTAGVGNQTQSLSGSVPVATVLSAPVVRAADTPRVSASMTNSALGGETIASHTAAQTTTRDQNISIAVKAQLAQQNYGVNGQGITIGIISNAFNSTSANGGHDFSTAVAGGWVDPNAVVLQDDNTSTGNEGLAMAEIVHQIAPNAHIIFYTADSDGLAHLSEGIAAAINGLTAAGCNIICDDQDDPAEPFYQPGAPADAAITNAVNGGVTYFTCAINNGPNAFYESQFNSNTVIQNAILPGNVTADAYNFGTAANPTPYELVDSTAGGFVLSLQWAQSWPSISGGTLGYTLQWYLYQDNNGTPGNVVASGIGDGPNNAVLDPMQWTGWNGVNAGQYLLSIVLASGTLPTTGGQFKILGDNDTGPSLAFETATGQVDRNAGVGSGSTWGHNENPNAITVGAMDYKNTPPFTGTLAMEPFSASGPGEYLFDANGNLLPSPQMLGKVNLAAPDGGATSLTSTAHNGDDNYSPFLGTSAATPAAAAVAALMLQINPTLTPAQIAQILQQTATPMPLADPLVAGSGLVNALAAVNKAMALVLPPNSPPAGTTANMVLSNAGGLYNIYNIGANSVLASYQLGLVGTDWTFVTLGGFNDGDTSDMLLRNSASGGFQVYDIANNNIYGSFSLGNVGLNWQVMGFGNFSSLGETDMIMSNTNTGGLQVYDINNNQVTSSALMGTVGLNWQFSGVGNFSGAGESDMLLRNTSTGGLQVYDINSNQITGSAFIGTVGLNWQFSGVGNFSSVPGETDLLLRNVNTGGLQVYDINNNQITGSAFLGPVGLDWQYAGVAAANGAGTSDLVLRNVNSGAFEVYDIANNQITGAASLGQVGPNWQVGGFAAAAPTGTAALVQAMAAFAAPDAIGTSSAGLFAIDTSQQPNLLTPGHA